LTTAHIHGNVHTVKVEARPYRQQRRAAEAEANTERILKAAHDLFMERPYDQVALAAVAERAGVGLQTLIRRVQTKDGLARAVNEWVVPQVAADRGEPSKTRGAPAAVAAAMARHYERWGESIDRMLRQEHVAPALTDAAAAGRAAHREWIEAAFAGVLNALRPEARRRLRARLVGVCGVELWLVLRRDEGLSVPEARDAVADLIAASLPAQLPDPES
jgi:AcrR family transcriptional regulator